ncbi:MAG: nickel-dependent hydrogenase large subunit [Deltaproteobacteria bacterium]|nr:nickel-dependent hydrogenase large subunit [Deltaproteobacteria bacterium]
MATVKIIDPVTRIEGHMSVEVTIDRNRVTDARCSGTLFRGFETILTGRQPTDAPVITQRICGVCPIAHGMASVNALDNLSSFKIPDNGRILRNLTLGANFIQSHILHFYFLAAPDFVAGPAMAPWTPAWNVDIRLPAGDSIASHLVPAIEARRRAHEMGAVFSGRMPTAHSFIPGGYTAVPSQADLDKFRSHLLWLSDFITNTYLPDIHKLRSFYSDYLSIGGGYGNLMAFGAFDLDGAGSRKLFRRGVVEGARKGVPGELNLARITESVTHSWYDNRTDGLSPAKGKTTPLYPKKEAYSWLKAPRYNSRPYEVGPLARMWVNGDYQGGVSVLDRHLARALEAQKVAGAMLGWLDQLNLGAPVYSEQPVRKAGSGVGLTEAARGALGHWVSTASGKITNYQIITPTCWNASPRANEGEDQDDDDDRNDGSRRNTPQNLGPMERALVGTPVLDPNKPIEVLRVIHSFDPCLSCAVHVMRPKKAPLVLNAGLAAGFNPGGTQC